MNREIKFRAWDKILQQMTEWDGLCIEENQVLFNDGDLYRDNNDVVLMQYTGLKDKDGKEIYDGDVVEKTNPKCQYQKSIIHCIVVWEDDRYMLKVCNVFLWEHYNVEKPENGTFLFFSWIHKDCYKIIGNIYDNPELLEVK